MIRKFFGRKAGNDSNMDCPECGRMIHIKDKQTRAMSGYHEIRRIYSCPKCAKEYGSVELVAPGKDVDLFLEAIGTLNKSMGDFYEALKKLLEASQKMDCSKKSVRHDTYGMN